MRQVYFVIGENRLIQKRKTMQIEWEKCFDVGILQGRVLQVLVQHEKITVADATMRLEVIFCCLFNNVFATMFLKQKSFNIGVFTLEYLFCIYILLGYCVEK